MAIDQVSATSTVYGAGGAEELLQRKPQTYWDMALRSLRRDKLTIIALVFLLIVTLLSAGAGAYKSASSARTPCQMICTPTHSKMKAERRR